MGMKDMTGACPYSGGGYVGLVPAIMGLVGISMQLGTQDMRELYGDGAYSGDMGDGGTAMFCETLGGVEYPAT